MQVPSSSVYFKSNQEEFKQIKSFTSKGNKSWFVKTACKLMRTIRRLFYSSTALRKDYQKHLENTKTSIEQNQYKANIEKYVLGVVGNCKQKAYNSFIAGMPELMKLVDQSKKFTSDLEKFPDLNRALMNIYGDLKVAACDSFVNLPTILDQIQTDSQDTPFLALVANMKNQFAEAKEYIDTKLDGIRKTMEWDWKSASSAAEKDILPLDVTTLEKVLTKKDVNLIKQINEWQNELQAQRDILIQVLPEFSHETPSFSKYYGYFTAQIDAVKKVSQRQVKEVSSRKKLEASLVSYLKDKINNESVEARNDIIRTMRPIFDLKSSIEVGKKEVTSLKIKLKSLDDTSPKYKLGETKLKTCQENQRHKQKIRHALKSKWNTIFSPLKSELKRKNKAVKKIEGAMQTQISALIELVNGSKKLRESISTAEKTYSQEVQKI